MSLSQATPKSSRASKARRLLTKVALAGIIVLALDILQPGPPPANADGGGAAAAIVVAAHSVRERRQVEELTAQFVADPYNMDRGLILELANSLRGLRYFGSAEWRQFYDVVVYFLYYGEFPEA